jgi:hypothetical protein
VQRRRAVALHGCVKSAIGAGKSKRREAMRLINTSELYFKTLPQLLVLYTMICQALAETEPCSVERANMIASLGYVSQAIAAHRRKGPKL